ncbi:Type I restriction modification DNA specificity domain protein [Candidatus Gugararchaeum adminiculabundum]|nr:Type I restriction modification DNA specificity domain protein [Candidatus Gugararchaeum adminiculabundum]
MECFTVYRNEIERRIDPHYLLNKNILEKSETKFRLAELGSILKKPVQYGANESAIEGNPKTDTRYIRITDIDSFGNLKDDDWKTAQKIDDKYTLEDDDVLFARSGATAGKCFIYKKDYGKSIFAGYLIRFIFDTKKVNPKYVFYYAQQERYKLWVNSIQRPSGQPNINSEEFKSFKIPLPPLEFQNKIVKLMENAYSKKKQKEIEAQQLIDSLDDYILQELGIELPELKNKMVYVVNSEEITDKRCDAYYFQPKFEEVEKAIKKGKYKSVFLKDIAEEILSGQRPKGGVRQISEGIPSLGGEHVLDDGSIEAHDLRFIPFDFHKSHLKSKAQKKDIIIVKDGATTGKVGIIPENYPHAEININEHVFLIRCKKEIEPYFLFSLLKSSFCQLQINREITGGTIMGIIRKSIEDTEIPLPPLAVQNKIAAEVKAKMQKAEQLQKEAKEGLEKAKKEVESLILG